MHYCGQEVLGFVVVISRVWGLDMCVLVSVCTYMNTQTGACACSRRAEVNVRCLPLALHLYFLRQDSHNEPEVHHFSLPTSPDLCPALVLLPVCMATSNSHKSCWSQVLMFVRQMLYQLSHFSSSNLAVSFCYIVFYVLFGNFMHVHNIFWSYLLPTSYLQLSWTPAQ